MNTDWKNTLAALKSQLPEEDTLEIIPEPESNLSIPADNLNILIEKKGRNGKTATIIEGFSCNDDKLQQFARLLKQSIGTGGSARGGEILLQGDWRTKAAEILKKEGFKIKGNF